jgi:mono/diheme cytochrome c family protein
VIAAIWKNDLRHWLIWINFVAFGALIVYVVRSVLAPKREPSQEKTPANLTPFLADEDLEGRRLERVLGWALIFAAAFAIALPLYWLREPTRQSQSNAYFDKNSVARGAILYANSASTQYNAAVSLQCANCHGQGGVGGVAPTTLNGVKVNWKVPPLNTEALRFEEDTDCLSQSRRQPNTICDLSDIITYGRPGTPMQPWGVVGGGPKNDQSIADLVSYIESIQLTPAQSQKAETDALALARSDNPKDSCPEYMTCPGIELAQAKITLAAAKTDLDTKRTAAQKALGALTSTDADLTSQCTDITNKADAAATPLTGDPLNQAVACGAYLDAKNTVKTAQAAVDWSTEWKRRRADVSDPQLLFELNCARCHTQGWSVFDPTVPPGKDAVTGLDPVNSVTALGLSGGGGGIGGGIGFNLRDGDVMRRFGTDIDGGYAAQVDFVSNGSAPFKPYGNLGLGSGKMPGFAQVATTAAPKLGAMLTPDQVKQIVYYERYCLDATTYTAVSPVCQLGSSGGTDSKVPATTTTTVAKKG